MQIDLFDTAEFIRKNNLREVSDPMLFVRGAIPSPNGLLSTDIFGVSMQDRKETFAYIDLHGIFLHPYVYKLLKRINRNFEAVVHGTKKFIIKDGALVVDEEQGGTGIEFIYNNWEKFKFESTDIAGARELRVQVLKNYTKKELFTKYWIVIPAFYRDVNFENMDSGRVSHRSEINDKYTKILRLSNMLNTDGGFDFVMRSTKANLQDTLVELYDFFKGKLAKKEGMLRRNLLGKSTDYASRCVISCAPFHANTPEEMTVDYYHAGIPLSHCCSMFNPFIVAWVRNFFRQKFETSGNKIPRKDPKTGEYSFVEVDSPELYFNDELIKKEIDNFIKNFHDRFKPVLVPIKDEKKFTTMRFSAREITKGDPLSESNATIDRPITWCDIFYLAAVEVTADKCVYITRYPISDYFSVTPMQIFVMSTNKTIPVYIDGNTYNHYPLIDLDMPREKISVSFADTVQMSNVYLKGYSGDYDGDQISVRGLFTQEANAEAIEQLRSKSRILTITGDNVRDTHHEPVQTLFSVTKF